MYDEDYYLRGRATGKSLYEDYRWLPELTVPMARRIVEHLGAGPGDTFLDFGCARGYLVKALRELGYVAYGHDASEWAVRNADSEVLPHLTRDPERAFSRIYDWVVAKDVLEHVEAVGAVVAQLMRVARKGVFAVVPLSLTLDAPYAVPEYELDVTHVHRWPLYVWAAVFMAPGWSVEARYRLRGVKDNYAQHKRGNGFVTCRRVPADAS